MNEHFFVRNLKLIKLIADKRKEKKNKPEFSTKEREVRPSQNWLCLLNGLFDDYLIMMALHVW